MSDQPTLRAQACRFRRFTVSKKGKDIEDWEPGIAFLQSFNLSDVSFIVDVNGEIIPAKKLYDYSLLQLRVDGYIAIEPGDYAGKRSLPQEETLLVSGPGCQYV